MLGKLRVVGRLPVVNVRAADVVPSPRTCLMRYVVLGSMPATRKFVLSPGTTGCETVLRQAGAATSGLYWTYIEVPAEGGALYKATRGLDVVLTTALLPVIRVPSV
jgi:hypothetical protein